MTCPLGYKFVLGGSGCGSGLHTPMHLPQVFTKMVRSKETVLFCTDTSFGWTVEFSFRQKRGMPLLMSVHVILVSSLKFAIPNETVKVIGSDNVLIKGLLIREDVKMLRKVER